jgi:hypothetical protein
MKITALIPDSVVNELKKLTKGKNTTDSLMIALREWIAIQKLKGLSKKIQKAPIKFSQGFSAENIRSLNRKR